MFAIKQQDLKAYHQIYSETRQMAKPFTYAAVAKGIKGFGLPFRPIIQGLVLLATLGIGIQFYIYVHQAATNSMVTVSRPAGVEGFLPIGALMGWKYFLLTGQWDPVHPAAMVILGFAVLISFLFRKSFCAWFCPVGTLSEGVWKLGRLLLGRNYQIPRYMDGILRSIKYVLLGFFLWVILAMRPGQIAEFQQGPYYQLADVKMLYFFTQMTRLTFIVLSILILLSLFYKNFWCRYACPYGALMGIFGFLSPTRIVRNQGHCTGCRKCDQTCPALLPVSKKAVIRSPECTGCMDCVVACPAQGALDLSTKGLTGLGWTAPALGTTILLLYIGIVFTANISGYWQGRLSDSEFALRLRSIQAPAMRHPDFNTLKRQKK